MSWGQAPKMRHQKEEQRQLVQKKFWSIIVVDPWRAIPPDDPLLVLSGHARLKRKWTLDIGIGRSVKTRLFHYRADKMRQVLHPLLHCLSLSKVLGSVVLMGRSGWRNLLYIGNNTSRVLFTLNVFCETFAPTYVMKYLFWFKQILKWNSFNVPR